MNKEILKGHLPVLVLGLLAEQPMHGYALCQVLRERCGRSLTLGDGTIYPLLYRLEQQGHVRGAWEPGGGKPRKIYRVTSTGKKLIRQHQSDWQLLAGLFDDILGKGWAA